MCRLMSVEIERMWYLHCCWMIGCSTWVTWYGLQRNHVESILSFLILFGSASSQKKSLCSFRSIKSGIREIRGMVHALIFSRFLTFYLFFQMTMSRIYPDFWTLICNFLRWMCCSDTSFSELFLSRICMVIQYLEDTNAKGAYRKLSFFIECFQGHDSNFRMISSPWELRMILKYYFISMCFDMV